MSCFVFLFWFFFQPALGKPHCVKEVVSLWGNTFYFALTGDALSPLTGMEVLWILESGDIQV